ncbi:hypothetical protein V6N12_073364 [Hibiscus sabdariffa]|uniref:Uncharacterized protein n=1 Tax=Hibiscus sabdariffa TaxID=183260 RepID=A0ABR2BT14_9ROSI
MFDLVVASMADSSGDSNWSLFQHMLPYHVLLRIAAIKAPTVQVGNDIMGWYGGVLNRFAVKLTYGCALS